MNRFFFLVFLFLTFQLFGQLSVAEYTIKSIKENTKYSDYGTSYFGKNKVVFSSNKIEASSLQNRFRRNRNENQLPRYDLFIGKVNDKGEINSSKRLMNEFTTKYNESNVSFTPDLKFVYFTQNNIKKGKYIKDESNWINLKIYRASVDAKGEWTNIISLPFNADNYSCAHPSVSEDGKLLFFTSDMPGTKGMSDLFWVTILEDGSYGEPQNIGDNVNSIAKENFPYVEGNILYFSSDRGESKGGLDIFMIDLSNPDAKPINLGEPINSAYDDFCFVIDREHKKGFFSSNRPKGKGQDDIYSFIQETEIEKYEQLIAIKIKDKATGEYIDNARVTIFSEESQILTQPVVNGIFNFKNLSYEDTYKLEITAAGYNKTFKKLDIDKENKTQEIIIYLEKLIQKETLPIEDVVTKKSFVDVLIEDKITIYKDGQEILDLPTVYFDLDRYRITKRSAETLNKVITILEKYPNIVIEFGSHTDCRSSDSYNLHLSSLRAKSVITYIKKKAPQVSSRIIGRGYGESAPVNHCIDGVWCSEKDHAKNRRAEFVVLKK